MRPNRIAYLRLLGRPYTLLYVWRSVGRPQSDCIYTLFRSPITAARFFSRYVTAVYYLIYVDFRWCTSLSFAIKGLPQEKFVYIFTPPTVPNEPHPSLFNDVCYFSKISISNSISMEMLLLRKTCTIAQMTVLRSFGWKRNTSKQYSILKTFLRHTNYVI